MQKESLSVMTVKILLAVLLFAGMGIIIIGGGCIVWEYSKCATNNQITKPVDQEMGNYYDVLEKKCAGDSCCLQSVKTMRMGNFKLVPKSGCQKGFQVNSLWCERAYDWCEQIEKNAWKNCDQDSDCIEAQAGCCDCKNGGEQTGINKKYLKAWESFWKTKCQNIDCISLFGCKDGKVVCENNQCEFKEEAKNNQPDTSNWQIYRNEEFGFEMNFPIIWRDYIEKPKENKISANRNTFEKYSYQSIYFLHAQKMSDKGRPGEVGFVIGIFDKENWLISEGWKKIGENDKYIFGSFSSNSAAPDDMLERYKEISIITSTFNL